MTGVVRVVALVVAIALPALVGCDDDSPPAVPEAGSACVAPADLEHGSLGDGTAVWIRSCPVRGMHRREAALLPTTVLTDGVADIVDGWSEQVLPRGEKYFGCGVTTGVTAYRFQVGYADGTVATVLGTTDGCPDRTLHGEQVGIDTFDDVARAIGHQLTDPDFTALGPVLGCPERPWSPWPRRAPLADETTAVVPRTADLVLVCTYDGRDHVRERIISGEEAEEVRLALMGRIDRPGGAWIGYEPGVHPAPVLALLLDAHHAGQWLSIAGAQHRLAVTLPETGRRAYLGKAGDALYELLTGEPG